MYEEVPASRVKDLGSGLIAVATTAGENLTMVKRVDDKGGKLKAIGYREISRNCNRSHVTKDGSILDCVL